MFYSFTILFLLIFLRLIFLIIFAIINLHLKLGCRQVVRPRVLVSLFEGSNPSALVKVSLIESLGGEMVNTIDSKSIT